MNISSAIKTAKTVITANSPVLLVGAAIAGVVATGVLAAKGGYKARGIIDDAELELGEPLDTKEKVKLTWLCYAVPGVTAASTIASVMGVHTIHTKRANAMAALYAVATTKLDDVSDKAEELLGTKKTQQLNDAMAQKAIDRNPLENNEVVVTAHGQQLFYEDWSGRWFTSSVAKVEEAANTTNREIIKEGSASVNYFFDLLGLKETTIGANHGWGGSDEVHVRFGGALTPDTESVVSVWFRDSPKRDYVPS